MAESGQNFSSRGDPRRDREKRRAEGKGKRVGVECRRERRPGERRAEASAASVCMCVRRERLHEAQRCSDRTKERRAVPRASGTGRRGRESAI